MSGTPHQPNPRELTGLTPATTGTQFALLAHDLQAPVAVSLAGLAPGGLVAAW